jgi:hypothetical protein
LSVNLVFTDQSVGRSVASKRASYISRVASLTGV